MSGAATQIADFTGLSDRLRETSKQFALERLAVKLVVNPVGVFVGDPVVAPAYRTYFVVSHKLKVTGTIIRSERVDRKDAQASEILLPPRRSGAR